MRPFNDPTRLPPQHVPDFSLYLVTDSAQCEAAGRTLVETVGQAVAAGVTTVQIREKEADARDFLCKVIAIAKTLPAHVTLLVNDRIDIYLAALQAGVHVHGVHIGQTEIPAKLARAIIGPQAILGLSAATAQTLAEASRSNAVSYVGIGPLHNTASKQNAPAGRGLPALQALRKLTHLPAVAIGGVTAADMPGLRAAGFDGAAIISAICSAVDPASAARALKAAWDNGPAPQSASS